MGQQDHRQRQQQVQLQRRKCQRNRRRQTGHQTFALDFTVAAASIDRFFPFPFLPFEFLDQLPVAVDRGTSPVTPRRLISTIEQIFVQLGQLQPALKQQILLVPVLLVISIIAADVGVFWDRFFVVNDGRCQRRPPTVGRTGSAQVAKPEGTIVLRPTDGGWRREFVVVSLFGVVVSMVKGRT